MRNKYLVRQNGYRDCGASCLLSIMKYYGCEASHEEVTYVLKTDSKGTNAYNIINGSKSFGFDGYGLHLSCDDIFNKKVSFPIICHVKKDNMLHFIVVYDIKKNKLIIMDPASDISVLSFDEFKEIYLNTSLFIYPIKDVTCEVSKDRLSTHLISLIKHDNKQVIKLIVFSIVSILLGIFSNYYAMIIIDYILPNYDVNILIKLTIVFLILIEFKNILNYLKGKYLIQIIENITIKFNNIIIFKIFNLPYQFFKNKSTGEVLSRINDLKTFREIISEIVLNTIVNLILIFVSIVLLLTINYKVFFIYLIGMLLYLVIVLIYKKIFINKSEKLLISDEKYNKTLIESISGYESNININCKNEMLKEIEFHNANNIKSNSNYLTSLNNQIFLKEIIVDIMYIVSVLISTILINKKIITIGEFFLFNSIIYYFTEPLKEILDLEPKINHIKNIYNRINDLLIYKSSKDDVTDEMINGNIVINNLSYSHNGIDNLFDNINIKINIKDKVLIYGESGIGKSTLMKIILKYLNEYSGSIYVNNINLKDINKNIISNSFTYVSQNSYVKNDTLKNNIIYGRNINYKEYDDMIHICNLDKLRNSSKLRDDFIIEDDGYNISGGERQKIVLARSLLKKSNYFILDEALSEVGVVEEKQILNRILNLCKDKTIIYISHKKEIINMFEKKYEIRKEESNVK